MKMFTMLLVFISLLVIVNNSIVKAQGGTSKIQGKVTDAGTGEPLFGSNVILVGTSLGAATGIDGDYQITNVPPGTYSVQFTYIGYKSYKAENVNVSPGKTLVLNAKLTLESLEGQTVVITAQKQGQISAINQQLSSNSIKDIVSKGGKVIFWGLTPQNQSSFETVLPYPVEVFERNATSLVPNENDNRVSSISYKDYYFTENTDSKTILKYALRGDFVNKGNILIKACPVDWSRSNNGGMMRSERENPEGPSLVELKTGKGAYLLSTINIEIVTPAHIRMITRLFSNLGIAVKQVQVKRGSLLDQTSVLTRSLVAGYYVASSFDEAFKKDFIGGETTLKPEYKTKTNGSTWNVEESKSGLFNFDQLKTGNSPVDYGAVYLSFWVQCPQPLNEIMADPNVPVVNFDFSAAGGIKIWLNGEEKFSSAKSVENGVIEKLPLKKGWNQFLVKVVKSGDGWSFKGRLNSKNNQLLSELGSALNPYSEKANFYEIMHTDPEIVYDHNWGLQGDGWYESATPRAKAILKFYGTGVALTGLVFPNGGKAKIFIDGKFDKIVDYKRDFRDPHYSYYSKSGLPDGGHEVTVEIVEGWVSVGPYEQWESYKSIR